MDLITFLNTHKSQQDCSHVSMGYPYGGFHISDMDLQEFRHLYSESLENNTNLHIAEMPVDIAPFILDIDFLQESSQRKYTFNHVKNLISLANKVLSKYYKVTGHTGHSGHSGHTIKAFILEKDEPLESSLGKYKDGLHVIYPYLATSKAMRTHMLDEIAGLVESKHIFEDLGLLNSSVVDKCVVRIPWLMYGSKKRNGKPYHLSYVINKNLEKDTTAYFLEEDSSYILVKELSIRKFKDKPEAEFNPNFTQAQLNAIKDKYKQIKKNSNGDDNDAQQETTSETNAIKAQELVSHLAEHRASDYNSWISVCWALKNTDQSLFPTFIEFSKRDLSKYSYESCKHVWDNARYDPQGGLTIKSLYYWAQQDKNNNVNSTTMTI